MFKVMLERNLGSVHSTITIEVRAANRDEAAAAAERELSGWRTANVDKA
jgi:hypothetical protein